MKGKGKCLCGSVELEVEYSSNELGACHCSMCRNWSGGPMLVIDCADSVKISGESNVVRYKSSDWAERGSAVNVVLTCFTFWFQIINITFLSVY